MPEEPTDRADLLSLTETDFADPDTYSYTETRGGRVYDVEGIGQLVNQVARALDAPTGQAKRQIRAGKRAREMAEAARALREEAEQKAKRAMRRDQKINAHLGTHLGYEVTREERTGPRGGQHDEYVIAGPYNKRLIKALKALDGRYDGEHWRVPVRTHKRFGEVLSHLDEWVAAQQDEEADRRAAAQPLCGTYGPLTVTISGPVIAFIYEYDEAINRIVKRHGARWSTTHEQWWVKLDALGAARAIIEDVERLAQKREAKKQKAKEQQAKEQKAKKQKAKKQQPKRPTLTRGRTKVIAGAVEEGDHIGHGPERKRVTGLGKKWTELANDENRYGLIGSPGGSQPWVDYYDVQYAYWVSDPEAEEAAGD